VSNNIQCEVSDDSTQAPSNMNFTSIGSGLANAALVVDNSSMIVGGNLTINAITANHYAAFIGTGGSLDLTNSTLMGCVLM